MPLVLPAADLGAVNATAPPGCSQVAGTDGTNLRPLSVDSTGKVNVIVTNPVAAVTTTGTAATRAASGLAYSTTTGLLTLTLSPVPVLAVVNPAGSGKSLYLSRLAFGSAVVGHVQVSIVSGGTWTGTNTAPIRRLPTSTTAAVAQVYSGTVTSTGGTSTTVGYLFGNGQQATDDYAGDLIVPPGYAVVLAVVADLASIPVGANVAAAVRLSWWES